MVASILSRVKTFWNQGHERSLKIKRNIVFTFAIKGLSISVSFLLVRLTIHYVDPVQYGIWITIASLVAWINTFDIGLSNGLRNKLTESLALNEKTIIKKYVSTTYALLLLLAIVFFILFFICGSFFNWNNLLNINKNITYNIWPVIAIALGFFCGQFFLQPVNSVLLAIHQPFKSSLITLSGQLVTLLIIFLLSGHSKGDLYILVLVVSGCPVAVLLIGSFLLYTTSLKSFAPSIPSVDFGGVKSLLNLGGAFFFIQIGALVLYETDNIIITRILGPLAVTSFNIAFKYFFLITTVFAIIVNPYWSAFTDAYAKKDFNWMRQAASKIKLVWVLLACLTMMLFLFANLFYRFWVGAEISIPTSVSLFMAIYVVNENWMVMHAYMLNGIGKLRVELILILLASILNVPLSVFFIKKIGISGTILSNTIVMFIMNLFLTYQCHLIMNEKARGIWNK